MAVRWFVAGFSCWALAALHIFLLVPYFERIPSDYAQEARYSATTRFRESAETHWSDSTLIARRVDQLLVSSATHAIIQRDLHWTNAAGQVKLETSAIFGVDRYTRENLPSYGDAIRSGPFLFPLHTEPRTYRYWDTQFIGHCIAQYLRTDDAFRRHFDLRQHRGCRSYREFDHDIWIPRK